MVTCKNICKGLLWENRKTVERSLVDKRVGCGSLDISLVERKFRFSTGWKTEESARTRENTLHISLLYCH